MLDMGFQEDIGPSSLPLRAGADPALFGHLPRVNYRHECNGAAEPVTVKVEAVHDVGRSSKSSIWWNTEERLAAVARILGHYRPESTLVFCNTGKECQEVADALTDRGFSALAIHGDLEQRERDQVLARFANKSVSILVATDVAARGIDIKELTAVINYELTRDPEIHIHRIGRTGRAGEQGLALSLVTAAENRRVAGD